MGELSSSLGIERVGRQDLAEVARVHRAAFPASALTELGEEAVRRYYLWQLEGPHDHHFVCVRLEGQLAGFCVSGISRGALSGFLRRNTGFLTAQVAMRPWLLANPIVRTRMGAALKLLRQVQRKAAPAGGEGCAVSWGILAIAVSPAVQGAGVAQHLLADCERVALARGFRRLHLTVAVDNQRAIRFYQKWGWRKEVSEGIWSGRMCKELTGTGAGGA